MNHKQQDRRIQSKSTRSSNSRKKNYFLLPIIFILLITPLLVHQYNYNNQYIEYSWFSNQEKFNDFFMYYKSISIIVIGFIIVGVMIYQYIYDKNIPKRKIWYTPLVIYTLLVILSAINSDYSSIVFTGSYEQFESTLVLLSYVLLLFYAYLNIRCEEDLRIIIKFTAIGIGFLTFIGFLQALGLDFFRTTLGKMLITKREEWSGLKSFAFRFEKNRVYSTLYNPNYVGVYASLFFPITLGYAILNKEKSKRIPAFILSVLLVVCTFGAQSKTGLIVLIITSVILAIVLRKHIFKNIKLLIISMSVFLIAFITINIMQDFAYTNMLRNAFTSSETQSKLTLVEPDAEYIKIMYNNKTIHIRCESDNNGSYVCELLDEENNVYDNEFNAIDSIYTLTDPVFNNITIEPVLLDEEGTFGCVITIENKKWYFKSKNETEGYQFVNSFGKVDTIKNAESVIFTKHGGLFTGRGYIWSRTLPLLKDHIILGSGPDTFAYIFPQNDYVGRYNNGFSNTIITKPHNMYLQIATQTGVISLVAFLSLYIMYFIDSLKVYHKSKFESLLEQMGLLILIGSIGYMISGFINDSTVAVAPLFWVLIGVGFACNRIIKEQRQRIERLRKMDK